MTTATEKEKRVRRITLPNNEEVVFHVQPFFLVISENLQKTCGFDRAGRLMSAFRDSINYRRGLNGDIMMKYFDHEGTKMRRLLSQSEAEQLVNAIRQQVEAIHSKLHDESFADIAAWIERILTWDADQLWDEGERFAKVYKPVGILPPDQYLSVVLQATEGCTWNKCTFCTLYRSTPFHIKTPQEFRQHVQQVKAFLGAGMGVRRSVFLADANALVIPQQRLLELLAIVHEELPLGDTLGNEGYVLDGIYAFIDIFGAEKKTLADYQELRDQMVKRVYIGLESGDETLFQMLNKPGSPEECVEVVQTIKAAGIEVGIILLAGAGGDCMAEQHVAHSLDIVARMNLGKKDIIYLSPLVVAPNSEYSLRMRERGIQPLSMAETMQQIEQMKGALKHCQGPRVTLYHIEEFLY